MDSYSSPAEVSLAPADAINGELSLGRLRPFSTAPDIHLYSMSATTWQSCCRKELASFETSARISEAPSCVAKSKDDETHSLCNGIGLHEQHEHSMLQVQNR